MPTAFFPSLASPVFDSKPSEKNCDNMENVIGQCRLQLGMAIGRLPEKIIVLKRN